jgi:hypothetical protein
VQRLGASGSLDADGELRSRVQAVLERRQLVDEVLGYEVGRRLGDSFEAHQRRADALPEISHGLRVGLRLTPPNRALHPPPSYAVTLVVRWRAGTIE